MNAPYTEINYSPAPKTFVEGFRTRSYSGPLQIQELVRCERGLNLQEAKLEEGKACHTGTSIDMCISERMALPRPAELILFPSFCPINRH